MHTKTFKEEKHRPEKQQKADRSLQRTDLLGIMDEKFNDLILTGKKKGII